MRVAGCVDVGIASVQVSVDLEASRVGGAFGISPDGFAGMIEQNEVGDFDHAEVDGEAEWRGGLALRPCPWIVSNRAMPGRLTDWSRTARDAQDRGERYVRTCLHCSRFD